MPALRESPFSIVYIIADIRIFMEDQHIYRLISRKIAGEATPAELSMLDKLLQEEPAWQYKYEMLARHWQAASQQEDDGSAATRYLELWQEMGARNINTLHAAPEAPRRRQYTRWLAAAAFMGLLATTGMYFLRRDKTTAATSEVATASGSRSKMLLPDGTQVWLNAGSRIVYNNLRFNSSNREVQLDGEAFFDVAPNSSHPFIIHTSRASVTVLGTAFNIRAYPGDLQFEASLIRGAIEVHAKGYEKPVRLRPNEKIVINTPAIVQQQLQPVKILPLTYVSDPSASTDSLIMETAWVENRLAFTSKPFELLAVDMERWYNVKFNFSDEAIKQVKFTGVFSSESLEQALTALQLTGDFKFRIVKNEVYILK